MSGKKGMLVKKPNSRSARQEAWQSMQIFIEFTADDILSTANIKISNLRKYITLLRRHGYIEEVGQTGKSGQLHHRKLYELMLDTGAQCPLVYRGTGLRDLNTGETFDPKKETDGLANNT